MATDIVASLFGVTPEMYQQRQMAQADERALQYAQLTPFQQANYAISRGGYGLAGALGGALGAQDPQLQLISQRNAIARQIDYNNPASIMEGQRLLARVGDTVGALQLANVARDLEYKQAQTTQSLAAAGASRAQAAKSQAEIDKIDRQQRAFALLTGAKPAEAAAVPAAAVPAAMPEAAVPAAVAPTSLMDMSQAQIDSYFSAGRQRTERTKREQDLAEIAKLTEDLNKLEPGGIGELSYENRRKFLTDRINELTVRTAAAPAAPTAVVPAAPAAAPAAAASTRASINQQIAALENRRKQFLALTEIPDAKAEAEILGDRIKDLREELKPDEIAKLERAIEQFRADGASDTDPRIKTRLDKIAKLSTPTSERFGTDREAISKEKFFKPFAELTQAQAAVVNAVFEERQGNRAEKGAAKFTLPGADRLADIPAFRAAVQRTIEPQLKSITAADQALTAINDSLATGNFASYRAAQVQFARAIAGAGDLSQKELKAAGADPSLLGGAADVISTAFTSTPSEDTQKKIRSTLRAIITVSRKQAKDEVDQQRKIALRSPGYNADAVNEALRFPQLEGGTVPTPAVTGGDLAAAAAAELARRRGGK